MKKILLSTTLLVATAGVAAAEVLVSGSGRAGLLYNEQISPNRANFQPGPVGQAAFDALVTSVNNRSSTRVSYRLRFNFDAKFEADNGVTYGGRIRMQNSDGQDDATTSPAYVYFEAAGFRVEVGNANSAYDSVALMYNSELGYLGRSFGDPQGSYFGFNSGGYGLGAGENRVGIYAAYSFDAINLKASLIQPNQVLKDAGAAREDEVSFAVDGTFGGFTGALAYAQNGGGIDNNDLTFVGVAYAFSDVATVGLNYNDNGEIGNVDVGNTITLYGSYVFSGVTVGAYVTNNDGEIVVPASATLVGRTIQPDTAFGIGASYDLGGATLAGSYQTGFYDGSDTFDVGVNFSF